MNAPVLKFLISQSEIFGLARRVIDFVDILGCPLYIFNHQEVLSDFFLSLLLMPTYILSNFISDANQTQMGQNNVGISCRTKCQTKTILAFLVWPGPTIKLFVFGEN